MNRMPVWTPDFSKCRSITNSWFILPKGLGRLFLCACRLQKAQALIIHEPPFSRAFLWIISTMIHDSLETMILRKEKSLWNKSSFGAWLKLLLHPKFQYAFFCHLGNPELQFLHQDRLYHYRKFTLGLHCKRGTQMWGCHFAFSARPTFFASWSPRDCKSAMFHQVWQNSVPFTELHLFWVCFAPFLLPIQLRARNSACHMYPYQMAHNGTGFA